MKNTSFLAKLSGTTEEFHVNYLVACAELTVYLELVSVYICHSVRNMYSQPGTLRVQSLEPGAFCLDASFKAKAPTMSCLLLHIISVYNDII